MQLLQQGPISNMEKSLAVIHTSTNNHLEVLKVVLQYGTIPDQIRFQAIQKAEQNNLEEIVTALRD